MKKTAQQIINETNAWLLSLSDNKEFQGPPPDKHFIEPMIIGRIVKNLFRKRAEGWPSGSEESGKGSSSNTFGTPKTKVRKLHP